MSKELFGINTGQVEFSTMLRGRHPGTQQAIHWFDYGHLSDGLPRTMSVYCAGLAIEMIRELNDGPELAAGLRKLREAKDCFVLQAVIDGKRRGATDYEV